MVIQTLERKADTAKVLTGHVSCSVYGCKKVVREDLAVYDSMGRPYCSEEHRIFSTED